MSFPSELVLASNNRHKLAEFEAMFAGYGTRLVSQASLSIPEAEEPHATFVENALAKARHASDRSGLWALADDSGLCIAALGGAPGVHSARYAGEPRSDARNNERVLESMRGVHDRRGHYTCVLVLVRSPVDPEPVIAEGRWRGVILESPRGHGGFGYDPLFYVPEHQCSVAELPLDLKNRDSHRARALRLLAVRLADLAIS